MLVSGKENLLLVGKRYVFVYEFVWDEVVGGMCVDPVSAIGHVMRNKYYILCTFSVAECTGNVGDHRNVSGSTSIDSSTSSKGLHYDYLRQPY